MRPLKVAIVHDYIKEYGGAERVLETLHEIYPDAPVFTSVYLPGFLGPHKERFRDWEIKTSWFQYVPFNYKLISPFRLIAPFVFKQFDLSGFDVVIVSATGAYFPNCVRTKRPHPSPLLKGEGDILVAKRKGAVQICYCHTPPRYLYGYATARDWKKHKILAVLGAIANHFLRMADFNASKNVDFYIANSEEVARRIEKFYRRDVEVIYPPVEIKTSNAQRLLIGKQEKKLDANELDARRYYLTGGRLARAKHVDLIIKTCIELDRPFKVFGRGFAGYEEELQKISKDKSNKVEFLGEVSDEDKLELIKNAKAFLFASEDEDFGLVPVEAMSCGTPVIAYKSGGVKETVIEGKTGLFFDTLTVDSLAATIKRFERLKIDPKDCQQQAGKFAKERFMREINDYVTKVWRNFQQTSKSD